MEKNNNVLIGVLVVIVLGLSVFICYDKFLSKPDNDKGDNKVEEKTQNDTSKEEEITNVNTIKELSNKVDAVNSGLVNEAGSYDENTDISLNTDIYAHSYKVMPTLIKNELTDDLKAKIILNSLYSEKNNINSELSAKYTNKTVLGIISKNDYDKRSVDLFGVIIPSSTTLSGCPSYVYEENYKVYVRLGACGFGPDSMLLLYKYKFTSLDNEAYVYISAAYDKFLGDNEGKIYKNFDLESDNMINENDYYSGDRGFKIGKDNYNDFVKFKYKFKKNTDGSYYFVSVEKL